MWLMSSQTYFTQLYIMKTIRGSKLTFLSEAKTPSSHITRVSGNAMTCDWVDCR